MSPNTMVSTAVLGGGGAPVGRRQHHQSSRPFPHRFGGSEEEEEDRAGLSSHPGHSRRAQQSAQQLEALRSMFGPRWTESDLLAVLRGKGMNADLAVEAILAHEAAGGTPSGLVARLSSPPSAVLAVSDPAVDPAAEAELLHQQAELLHRQYARSTAPEVLRVEVDAPSSPAAAAVAAAAALRQHHRHHYQPHDHHHRVAAGYHGHHAAAAAAAAAGMGLSEDLSQLLGLSGLGPLELGRAGIPVAVPPPPPITEGGEPGQDGQRRGTGERRPTAEFLSPPWVSTLKDDYKDDYKYDCDEDDCVGYLEDCKEDNRKVRAKSPLRERSGSDGGDDKPTEVRGCTGGISVCSSLSSSYHSGTVPSRKADLRNGPEVDDGGDDEDEGQLRQSPIEMPAAIQGEVNPAVTTAANEEQPQPQLTAYQELLQASQQQELRERTSQQEQLSAYQELLLASQQQQHLIPFEDVLTSQETTLERTQSQYSQAQRQGREQARITNLGSDLPASSSALDTGAMTAHRHELPRRERPSNSGAPSGGGGKGPGPFAVEVCRSERPGARIQLPVGALPAPGGGPTGVLQPSGAAGAGAALPLGAGITRPSSPGAHTAVGEPTGPKEPPRHRLLPTAAVSPVCDAANDLGGTCLPDPELEKALLLSAQQEQQRSIAMAAGAAASSYSLDPQAERELKKALLLSGETARAEERTCTVQDDADKELAQVIELSHKAEAEAAATRRTSNAILAKEQNEELALAIEMSRKDETVRACTVAGGDHESNEELARAMEMSRWAEQEAMELKRSADEKSQEELARALDMSKVERSEGEDEELARVMRLSQSEALACSSKEQDEIARAMRLSLGVTASDEEDSWDRPRHAAGYAGYRRQGTLCDNASQQLMAQQVTSQQAAPQPMANQQVTPQLRHQQSKAISTCSSLSSLSSSIAPFVTVEGAGIESVNGVYYLSGACNGTGMYSKPGILESSPVTFTLFRCRVATAERMWFISVVPEDVKPGTDEDKDFYAAPENPPGRDGGGHPPCGGWVAVQPHGARPVPTCSWEAPSAALQASTTMAAPAGSGMEKSEIESVHVDSAGSNDVNGVYRLTGTFDGAGMYTRKVRWGGRSDVKLALFRSTSGGGTRRWFLSIIPECGSPGTHRDTDLYTADNGSLDLTTADPTTRERPPRSGWKTIPGFGLDPPPRFRTGVASEAICAMVAPRPAPGCAGSRGGEWVAVLSDRYEAAQPRRVAACAVCRSRPATHILIPCGHPCLCDACSDDDRFVMLRGRCPVAGCEVHSVMCFHGTLVEEDPLLRPRPARSKGGSAVGGSCLSRQDSRVCMNK